MSDIILTAARYARDKHAGQVRKYTGTPYIYHPMRVAGRVSMLRYVTEDTVAAAWLHDVIEDCGVTYRELEIEFGCRVANMVDMLTNPPKEPGVNRAERKWRQLERLQSSSINTKRIKLLDRIDNLNEMHGAADDFKRLYARESVDLAQAIGDADELLRDELLMAQALLLQPAQEANQ